MGWLNNCSKYHPTIFSTGFDMTDISHCELWTGLPIFILGIYCGLFVKRDPLTELSCALGKGTLLSVSSAFRGRLFIRGGPYQMITSLREIMTNFGVYIYAHNGESVRSKSSLVVRWWSVRERGPFKSSKSGTLILQPQNDVYNINKILNPRCLITLEIWGCWVCNVPTNSHRMQIDRVRVFCRRRQPTDLKLPAAKNKTGGGIGWNCNHKIIIKG